ncbi:MAG: hypothetical protein RL318_272 [Fibrobacterota bacterium]|jgi:curli biogenesis system outer membrane secretion channel CsgG
MFSRNKSLILACSALLGGCASQIKEVAPLPPAPPVVSVASLQEAGLKQRIATVKFEDKTGYGNNLFGAVDDLGSQAADLFSAHMIKTGQFVVIERQELPALQNEAKLQGAESQFASVSALVFGAVTEFGTKTEWEDRGLTKTKVQTAHAKVAIRLVDPRTGVAFFSEFGEADARNESSQTLGFGGKADHDATLTDKALNAAIAKLTGNVMNSLKALPWRAPILDVQDGAVAIGAGKSSNLKVGATLDIYKPGKKIMNKATNTAVELPGTVVGKAKVLSLFGQGLGEGAMCQVLNSAGTVTTDMDVRLEGKE